jgi:hypothetical protein
MSVIETPPPDRQPVETVICAYDERIIRDAINREMARGGQVYMLHNRIGTIEKVANRITELCPGARVIIGHGRMEEGALEGVMKNFVEGGADVLVSTTIIESGLDIPNANTIIIDRADRFGLADLYQLRGRVGRGALKAYAYLMLPRDMMMVGEARRRVQAIRQYSQLGSGFRIAMRDLEIRGAGNLLGTAQSGHIAAVGFDLYCKMLKQAVERMKSLEEGGISTSAPDLQSCLLRLDFVATSREELLASPLVVTGKSSRSLHCGAFIPADYLPEAKLRIDAHRSLAAAAGNPELHLRRSSVGGAVLIVVVADLQRRDDDIVTHLGLAHRLDDHLVFLHIAEAGHRVPLRLKCPDKGGAISSEISADDSLHGVIDHIGGDGEFLLLELLENEGTIDEILNRQLTHLLDLIFQLRTVIDLGSRLLLGSHQFTHLRKGDDITIDHGGDAVDHLFSCIQGD